jgi:hypothetical protein
MLSYGALLAMNSRQTRPQTDRTTPSQGLSTVAIIVGIVVCNGIHRPTPPLHGPRCCFCGFIAGADARVGEVAAVVAGVVVSMEKHRKPAFKAPIYLTGVVPWLKGLGCPISPLLRIDSMEAARVSDRNPCMGSPGALY